MFLFVNFERKMFWQTVPEESASSDNFGQGVHRSSEIL